MRLKVHFVYFDEVRDHSADVSIESEGLDAGGGEGCGALTLGKF